MVSSVVAAVGCASGDADAGDSADSDLTGTGTCRVMHEDNEVVVLRGPDGKTMYAAKQLHVTDVRVTPASSTNTSDWAGSRFAAGHIQYTIAAKARPESLARLNQLVGPGTPAALVTLDVASAGVDTAIRSAAATGTANADGSVSVDLADAPAPNSPFMASSLRKAMVVGAHANATIACGTNAIPLAINTTGNVTFDVDTAKVLTPDTDLAAIDTFLGTANAIRGNAYKDSLAQVNNPDLNAKMNAFADVVDREIKPVTQAYGASMTRGDVKTHLQTAYNAYRDLSATVLTATKQTSDVDHLQSRNADGSYAFAAGTPDVVSSLLPTANAMRANVEKALADNGDGWTIKDLQ